MSAPTTSIAFSLSTPAAPTGDQDIVFQSDGATPQQKVSGYPQRASGSLYGTVLASAAQGVIGLVIDGGGSVPATGAKGFVQVPFGCTITGWTMLADQSGSAQITVSKGAYSAFPTLASIDASAPPNLSTAQKATSTTLTGWTTAISAGDVLGFNLDSVAACQRIILELQVTKN